MKLQARHLDKVDEFLRVALESAAANDHFRVILAVDDAAGERKLRRPSGDNAETAATDFASRTDYRKALIEEQKKNLDTALEGIRRALEAQSLELRGGGHGHLIVADGQAADIVRALDVPGVKRALLDRSFEMIPPKRTGKTSAK